MRVRLCFSFEDTALVHLAPSGLDQEQGTTLCGKRAFLASLSRRKITCEECVKLKPRQLGGGTQRISPR